MEKTTKILAWGSSISLVIALLVLFASYQIRAQSDALDLEHRKAVAICQAKQRLKNEGWEDVPKKGTGHFDPSTARPVRREDFGAVAVDPCASEDLQSSIGTIGEIDLRVAKYRDWDFYVSLIGYTVAAGMALLSVLPWFWYFLIRRIRELSDAIRGK
jgi:hypothetical protein